MSNWSPNCGRLLARYLENGDVPGETLYSFAQLASLQSLLLPESRQILVKVHSWRKQTEATGQQWSKRPSATHNLHKSHVIRWEGWFVVWHIVHLPKNCSKFTLGTKQVSEILNSPTQFIINTLESVPVKQIMSIPSLCTWAIFSWTASAFSISCFWVVIICQTGQKRCVFQGWVGPPAGWIIVTFSLEIQLFNQSKP